MGTSNRISKVPVISPKTKLAAMGINTCACKEVSNSIGESPATVVNEVNMIGRKRRLPALTNASNIGRPARISRLMQSTKTIESLTTTPVNAIKPKKENSVKSICITACPKIAPNTPKGMIAKIINGCK